MSSQLKPGVKAFDAFHDYWNQLLLARRAAVKPAADECPVPLRRDFNPMKVHRHLPHIYIVERKLPDLLELRLSGTAIEDVAGNPLKGSNYFDFSVPEERAFTAAIVDAVIDKPCGLKMSRNVKLIGGQAYQLRSLSFPLAEEDGTPRFLLGMTNVIRDIPQSSLLSSEAVRVTINDFSFIDIGAGTPPKPNKRGADFTSV